MAAFWERATHSDHMFSLNFEYLLFTMVEDLLFFVFKLTNVTVTTMAKSYLINLTGKRGEVSCIMLSWTDPCD